MITTISHAAKAALKTVALAAALSAFAATAASAQAAISEPAAYQALYPYRDVLNGGAPTRAAALVLQPPAVLQAIQQREAGIGIPAELPRHRRHHRR
ncbi:hypothetical protein J6500_10340 [Bradyrhizobium sp. WSM 1704]|uniref:hypothetical protein n=1 Tax=Bradyrhizobium semiaridum TaxID=2821404 RepID=UPI001CE32DB3|nr:hypothetical protein [Bradyrhizobium semiaridum]MCA6122283.1 hypothetical protein [Bradyrhizobium semiaridum]